MRSPKALTSFRLSARFSGLFFHLAFEDSVILQIARGIFGKCVKTLLTLVGLDLPALLIHNVNGFRWHPLCLFKRGVSLRAESPWASR